MNVWDPTNSGLFTDSFFWFDFAEQSPLSSTVLSFRNNIPTLVGRTNLVWVSPTHVSSLNPLPKIIRHLTEVEHLYWRTVSENSLCPKAVSFNSLTVHDAGVHSPWHQTKPSLLPSLSSHFRFDRYQAIITFSVSLSSFPVLSVSSFFSLCILKLLLPSTGDFLHMSRMILCIREDMTGFIFPVSSSLGAQPL